MFKLATPSDDIAWPVTVPFVDGKGKTINQTFTAKFPRLPQSQLDSLVQQAQDKAISDDELASQILIGWDGVADENGQPIEFNPAIRDQLLDIHPTRSSVITAWFDSLSGGKRKN